MRGEYVQVVTTLDDEARARSLAREVVKARLAACAQVWGPISSVYWWEGEMEEAQEFMVAMKTKMDLYAPLEEFIRERHPYTVPEILAFAVVEGSKKYLDWLDGETLDLP